MQIFIGGSGRCGTTILKKLLTQHTRIYGFPFEVRFITDPDGVIDLVEALSHNWSPFVADKAIYHFAKLS